MNRQQTERLLDATKRFLFWAFPEFAERVDIAIRAQVYYTYLYRDKPLPDEQIHNFDANVPPRVMWRRHLDKYLDVYEEARISGLFPKTEDIKRHSVE